MSDPFEHLPHAPPYMPDPPDAAFAAWQARAEAAEAVARHYRAAFLDAVKFRSDNVVPTVEAEAVRIAQKGGDG